MTPAAAIWYNETSASAAGQYMDSPAKFAIVATITAEITTAAEMEKKATIPKEVHVEDGGLDDLTDEELLATLEYVRGWMANSKE
jgi:hypothetical protein